MTDRRSPPSGASRREFLLASAASAALVTRGVAPASLPRPTKLPADPVRLAVLGVGGMGGGHCEAFLNFQQKKLDHVLLTAVNDVCTSRRNSWAERATKTQGVACTPHADYREILDRKDIDAVLIATPEHWHAKMAIEALQAGKPVYVEKPMTLDLPDALALWAVAKNAKPAVQVGTQFVMDPKYKKAKELLAQDRIGKPVSSETGYCRNSKDGEWNYYKIEPEIVPGPALDWDGWCGPLGKQPWDPMIFARWRRYRKFSTGVVGDLLVHVMTPLIGCIDQGWPVRVIAAGGHYIDKAMENHDQVDITIQFEKGHTMRITGSTCNANGPTPVVRGHKGTLYLSGNNCRIVPENIYAEEIDGEEIKLEGGSQDLLRLDFLKAVRGEKAPESPIELGMKVMVAVDLATRSMWDGCAYSFNPATLEAKRCTG